MSESVHSAEFVNTYQLSLKVKDNTSIQSCT